MVCHLFKHIVDIRKHGYYIDKDTPVISTPFADDFNVISTNARTHQRLLNNVEKFAKSMNLVLEPRKCKSLSICSGSSKIVTFHLTKSDIPSIHDSPEKFLGSTISFSGKQKDTLSTSLPTKLQSALEISITP